ncbi:MAG: hypothetical protein GY696_35535 [Gammaproteobacteria bacterium]|nr:hypothetical protein [Gammaproteobacteria bacterium]
MGANWGKAPANPSDPTFMTLAKLNDENAFGAVERGGGGGGHKAPVNPLDPAYMTLADLNNQDAFGAVQRGEGGGGRKAPVNPLDPGRLHDSGQPQQSRCIRGRAERRRRRRA